MPGPCPPKVGPPSQRFRFHTEPAISGPVAQIGPADSTRLTPLRSVSSGAGCLPLPSKGGSRKGAHKEAQGGAWGLPQSETLGTGVVATEALYGRHPTRQEQPMR
jgi:hypothetical protein